MNFIALFKIISDFWWGICFSVYLMDWCDIKQIKPPSFPEGRFTQILSVGIGGSALGPQFVAEALAPDNPPLKVTCGLVDDNVAFFSFFYFLFYFKLTM